MRFGLVHETQTESEKIETQADVPLKRFHPVLVSAGIQLILFPVAGTVLRFGFTHRILLSSTVEWIRSSTQQLFHFPLLLHSF